ncbi:unnamed protein product [Rhodiola kirilowii]
MSTGPSWLVDSHRIATKIKSSACASSLKSIEWKSNPCRACPNCQHVIDNSDVAQEWPGLPRGVKFDPTDQEIIWHLLAKCGVGNLKPHPFIDEFIPTVNNEDGICYTHPQNLPGVKHDGNVAHFFHRAIKAYNTGSRKRRKIHGNNSSGDVRWHKTGRTKPVVLDGVQKGCKKIMVLYVSPGKGGKAEKTNWVMHQYHLGTDEDEKDGEYVISKIFYQQQPGKANDIVENELSETSFAAVTKVDPVTPKSVIPIPPRTVAQVSDLELAESALALMEPDHQHLDVEYTGDLVEKNACKTENSELLRTEDNFSDTVANNDNSVADDPTWWENESLVLLNSQQLAEGLSLCDELLQSQSPNRQGLANPQESKGRPRLADYSQLGPEDLKKDLEECQNLEFDPSNIELGTPPDFRLSQEFRLSQDFRLSQLEFCSQDSFCAWGGNKVID